MFMHVCVHVYVLVCERMCVHVYVLVCVCVCVRVCCVCMRACMHASACVDWFGHSLYVHTHKAYADTTQLLNQ